MASSFDRHGETFKIIDYVARFGISPSKVFWLRNGVNLERFDMPVPLAEDGVVSETFQAYNKDFKVVYVGSHGPANGLDVVIDAPILLLNSHPRIYFFLMGDGVEKGKLIIEAETKRVSNTSFLPSVLKSQVPSDIRQADLTRHVLRKVETLHYGLSSNKINEYMASSKPIVAAVDASSWAVRDANCGFIVDPEDPKALASALVKIEDIIEEEQRQLGANGRRYVKENHDIIMDSHRVF